MGYAYSNNGLGWRRSAGADLQAGEVYFADAPTTAQLQAAFPGYNAAVAAQQAQQAYAAAIAAGLTITSNGTPAINGNYALDAAQQQVVTEMTAYIQRNNTFPGALASVNLRAVSGAEIAIPNITVAMAIFTAIADYIAKCDAALLTAQAGGTPTQPSAIVTIA